MNYIFDFDGTLVDSGKTGQLATAAAFKDHGLAVPSNEQMDYYMGIPIDESFKAMSPDVTWTDDAFAELLKTFRRYYQALEGENMALFAEIADILAQLKADGNELFIASSKSAKTLDRNLIDLGIKDLFTDIVSSDSVENFKPHPEGVQQLLERHDLAPNETLMIGDAVHDLQMGQAAGVQTVAVTWGAHAAADLKAENPDYILNQPAELLTFIQN